MTELGDQPCVHPEALITASRLGRYTEVGPRAVLEETELRDYAYVMQDTQIAYADIGRFCSIASHVRVNPGNHPLDRAALHHFTYRASMFGMGDDDAAFFDWRRSYSVALGPDCWVGHGAIILPGVSIGTGAAIAAGAVVSRDVPDFNVVAGIPARPLRERFPRHVQAALRRIRWWDWPHAEIAAALADFRALDAAGFCRKYDPAG